MGIAANSRLDLPVPQDPTTAFNTVAGMGKVGSATINYVDPNAWQIGASCSLGMRSWGEDIVFGFFSGETGGTVITIQSTSSMPTAVFDMGKNMDNVNAIYNELRTVFWGVTPEA